MRRPEPRLSQLGPALAWLLFKGVSSSRLASLLNATPENVRVIAFRSRHGTAQADSDELALDYDPLPELPETLGVRPPPDDVVRTPVGARKLEKLRGELDETVVRYSTEYQFADGARALRRLAPQIGYAGDSRRIALSALLHQQAAWFLVHSGRCDSAIRDAQVARNLWRIAHHESPCREYAERFIQSALIGSQALLLTRRPEHAWHLEVAGAAADSISSPLGSEYFRQRGVALFQLREDERAVQQFEKAAEAMETLHEAKIPAQLLMTGARHTNLIGRVQCDSAQEIVNVARRSFGDDSLEASMALHWAAACGLSTDSSSATLSAIELLLAHPEPAAQFGHQTTIRKLLALTPDLGLDTRLRQAWVRRTLYENAFRGR